MAKLVFNRDGGKTDEFGHLLGLSRLITGEVIDGLQIVANGVPNMSVVVGYGTGAIPTGSAGTAYRYFMGVDANENVTIPTANGSNPRNDLIVAYIDKNVTPSTSFTNNSNAVLKIVVVSGAPAVTPADPSGATIQAAVGAGNPYIILARVVTGAGVTQINNGNITDLRSLASIARLLNNSITTAHLQDLLITTAKIANGAVTYAKTDGKTWYEEVGRHTLAAPNAGLVVTGIPARKYLRLIITHVTPSGATPLSLRFNGVSSAQYSGRQEQDGGADATTINGTSAPILNSSTGAATGHYVIDIVSPTGSETNGIGHGVRSNAGSGAATTKDFVTFKWANTAIINQVNVITNGATLSAGSELIVLAHN